MRRAKVAGSILTGVLAVALLLGAPWGAAPAGAAVPLQGELSIADAAALARPAVVDVVVAGESGGSGGSGVRLGAGIVTTARAVGDAKEVDLRLPDGSAARAAVVRVDVGYDLALLSPGGAGALLPALELEPLSRQRQGDTALVLAYPGPGTPSFSREVTLTRGIISAVRADEESGALLVQTDAPLRAGASGGALLSLRGGVIGIPAYTKGDASGLGFAVASDSIRAFLDGQPSLLPVGRNLSAYLVPASELGPGYEGTIEPSGPREREASAYFDSPFGPAMLQFVIDAGTPEQAAAEIADQATTAEAEGLTEVRMAITGGKRVFAGYTADAQEMTVLASKGPFVVVVYLDFAGLPDTGRRTEQGIRVADLILARIPG